MLASQEGEVKGYLKPWGHRDKGSAEEAREGRGEE